MAARKGRSARGRRAQSNDSDTGPVAAERARLEREARRLKKRNARLKGYGLPNKLTTGKIDKAIGLLLEAATELNELPEDWRPARGSLGPTIMEEGASVFIKPSMYGKYESFMDCTKPLLIEKVSAGKIICRTTVGTEFRMPVPRSHLQLSGG